MSDSKCMVNSRWLISAHLLLENLLQVYCLSVLNSSAKIIILASPNLNI